MPLPSLRQRLIERSVPGVALLLCVAMTIGVELIERAADRGKHFADARPVSARSVALMRVEVRFGAQPCTASSAWMPVFWRT